MSRIRRIFFLCCWRDYSMQRAGVSTSANDVNLQWSIQRLISLRIVTNWKTDALLPLTKIANYSSLFTAHLAGEFLLQCACQICDSFVAGFSSSPFATESHYESSDVLEFWRLCWGSVWTQGFANIQASISTSRQVPFVGIWVIWRSYSFALKDEPCTCSSAIVIYLYHYQPLWVFKIWFQLLNKSLHPFFLVFKSICGIEQDRSFLITFFQTHFICCISMFLANNTTGLIAVILLAHKNSSNWWWLVGSSNLSTKPEHVELIVFKCQRGVWTIPKKIHHQGQRTLWQLISPCATSLANMNLFPVRIIFIACNFPTIWMCDCVTTNACHCPQVCHSGCPEKAFTPASIILNRLQHSQFTAPLPMQT